MKKMRKLLLVVSTAFMVSSTTTLSVLAEKINTNVTTEDVFSICESLWADAEEKTDSMSHEEMFGDSEEDSDGERYYEGVLEKIYDEKMKEFDNISPGDNVSIDAYILETIELPQGMDWQIDGVRKSGAYRIEISLSDDGKFPEYDEFAMFIRSDDENVMEFKQGQHVTVQGIFLKPGAISALDYLYDCSITEYGTNVADTEVKNEAGENATLGERNALQAAQNYLSLMPFPYTGLIKQLEFEKYTTEEATYAADNCGADWYSEAEKAAERYLNIMSFSRDGLIEQLEFEGYTKEQAEHGVKAVGY